MSSLNNTQLQTLRRVLDEREAELRTKVQAVKRAAEERPSAQGPQVEDIGEEGEQRFRNGIEHAEMQRDLEELADIDTARARMDAGTYGECIVCGRDIAFERLKAQPRALRCINCQTAHEKTHRTTPRYSA